MTIPEGYTIDQIAQAVGQLQGEFKEPLTAEAFLAKVQDDNFISQEVAKYPNLLEACQRKKVEFVTVWKVIFPSDLHLYKGKHKLLKV